MKQINQFKPHYFYNGPFSNWHRASFTDPSSLIVFSNSEQFFMFMKARFFGDEETAKKIAATPHPAENKALGRQIRNYNDKAWEIVRFSMMVYANYLKFTQNTDLKWALLETNDTVLVEASPYDKIWGIGISVGDAEEGRKWDGKNLLGEALMFVRKMIREEETKTLV